MILVIDNYDSFVYNLVQYLGELGEKTEVYRNDSLSLQEIEMKIFYPNGFPKQEVIEKNPELGKRLEQLYTKQNELALASSN